MRSRTHLDVFALLTQQEGDNDAENIDVELSVVVRRAAVHAQKTNSVQHDL